MLLRLFLKRNARELIISVYRIICNFLIFKFYNMISLILEFPSQYLPSRKC